MSDTVVAGQASVPLPDFSQVPKGESYVPRPSERVPRVVPLGTSRRTRRSTGNGRPYRLTVEQVTAVRHLSELIDKTCAELCQPIAVGPVARKVGMNPQRLRVLLRLRTLPDADLAKVAAKPGELRRPRRSTLRKIAHAAGLPEVVVDLWSSHCPLAIAKEDPR